MLARGVEIVGIQSCAIERSPDGRDVLVLRLVLSDGGIAATHWRLSDMCAFVSQVEGPQRRPIGAALQ